MPSHRIPRRMAPLLAASALALLGAAPALAAPPAPSLSADTSFASSGFTKYDYSPTSSTDSANGAGVDAALGRLYAIGEVSSSSTDDLAVIAWKTTGVRDTSFGDNGQALVDVTTGKKDLGAALAVLPDHRLRIVGATNVSPTSTSDLDVTVVGLNADGSRDTTFGPSGNGVVTFPVHSGADDTPTHLSVGADGRLAIAGYTKTGSAEDSFVAVRNADGSPAAEFGANGVKILNEGGGSGAANVNDRGVGVAWRPGGDGPVVLSQVSPGSGIAAVSMHAFTGTGAEDNGFSGDGDQAIDFGAASASGAGLLAYGGRLWTTGSVTASDSNGFLARVDSDGSNLQIRQFDTRGSAFKATDPVSTQEGDLTIVPGDPDTLVVGGSTATTAGREFAGAAFNGLDADLASMGYADLVIPVSGQGNFVGVAGAPDGSVAAAGVVLDYSTQTQSGTFDYSMTMSRMLIDAEKTCDLSIKVPRPLELTFRGLRSAAIRFTVANAGLRACTGAISVPAPYALSVKGQPGPISTGRLAPGQSLTIDGALTYAGHRPAQATLTTTLTAPGDSSIGDNTATTHVQFSYCDAQLVRIGSTGVIAAGTTRGYDFTVRNRGTAACRGVHLVVGRGAHRVDGSDVYTVSAGRSVTDSMTVAVDKAPKLGATKRLTFSVRALEDVLATGNRVVSSPKASRGADSNARKPAGRGRRYAGRTAAGKGRGKTAKSLLKVRRVDVAILAQGGKSCRWISNVEGRIAKRKAGRKHACTAPVWLTAKGTRKWSFALAHRLPKGRYVLLTRAVQANEVAENRFSAGDHNRLRFRVR